MQYRIPYNIILPLISACFTCRMCQSYMRPDMEPHRCLPGVIAHCPDGYNGEVANLCENGPVAMIKTCDGIFKNEFCALCQRNGSLEALVETKWVQHSAQKNSCNDTMNGPVDDFVLKATQPIRIFPGSATYRQLMTLQPQLQVKQKVRLSQSDYIELTRDELMYSMLNDGVTNYTYRAQTSAHSELEPAWDLGSLRCHSVFESVCYQFIKLPDKGCGGPGCGVMSIQDALNEMCLNVDSETYKSNMESVRKMTRFMRPLAAYERQLAFTYLPGSNCG